MTTEQRIEKANAIKKAIAAINPTAGSSIRIWSKGDQVRLYTDGNGYTAILEDGSIDKIKRQGWGDVIVDAITAIA